MGIRRLSFLVVISLSFLFACGSETEGEGESSGGLVRQTLPEIEAYPMTLKFAPAAPGVSQTLTVTLKNTGAGDELVIRSVYMKDKNGPFECTQPGKNRLKQLEQTSVSVTYTAGFLPPPPNVLVIESNAAERPVLEIDVLVGQGSTGLLVFPNPIDFGEVLGNEPKIMNVQLVNAGTAATEIKNVFLKAGGSEDFELTDLPALPVTLEGGFNVMLELTYTPTGGGVDTGTLVVAHRKESAQSLIEVPVRGKEVGPELSASPAMIDFGWVAMGDKAVQELLVFNTGEHDLKISKVYPAPLSNPDISIANAPEGVVKVKKGEKTAFEIVFEPKDFFAVTTDPIGGIVIESNDADEGLINIPVYGNIDAAFIKVVPPDKVDFGIVAQGWTIKRDLAIQNVGHAPLKVTLMEITQNTPNGEFKIEENAEFPPTKPGGGEGVILPDDTVVTVLAFTNEGGASGSELGVLHIVSNDPITPDLYLDLSASRGGNPSCKLGFVPSKLDFGTVAHGSSAVQEMFVKNVGSGYCSWKSGKIIDCTSFMGMMTSCFENGPKSKFFTLQGMPIPMQDGMAPGTAHPVQILYKPPTTIPWIPIAEEYYAVLQVTYTEPYSQPNEYTEHTFPEAGPNGSLNWNIHGASGVADIAVLPPEVEFGLITIGCYSQTFCVKVYNAGTAPLELKDIYTEGCGPEFQAKNYPALPKNVGESKFEEVCVVYLPQNEGKDECFLVVESSDLDTPVLKVPIKGEGTWDTEHTDYFTQVSGKKVDILFVIDDSGSMCGEQDNLVKNFNALTEIAAQWGNDYQIGITTTDITNEKVVGKLYGSPRIIDKSTVSAFGPNVESIGCNGAGEQEAGLEAGRRALTPPHIVDTDIPCNCPEDQPCPGVCSETELCVKGKCGGYNRGFLRPDAALEVVFVSDEEDQSPGSLPFYIDFYKSIKGFLNTEMFHAHAITGGLPNGCQISAEDGAEAGKRYIEVQEATGGVFGKICDESFSQVLQDIGNKAFGLQVQFFLSAQADSTPGNIRVWVDQGTGEQECKSGWSYDAGTNSVFFDENGPCMPQAGDKIKIWYKMVCNSE